MACTTHSPAATCTKASAPKLALAVLDSRAGPGLGSGSDPDSGYGYHQREAPACGTSQPPPRLMSDGCAWH